MITEKQRLANTQNAQSGGVKTTAGKAISKYNAIKHGIFTVLLTDYEEDYCRDTLQTLTGELQPVGFLETMLVERIAICYVRLYRIAKAEHEFMRATLDPFAMTVIDPSQEYFESVHRSVEKVTTHGYKPQVNSLAIGELTKTLMRYDTTTENRLYKALHELLRLQATRRGEKPAIPSAIDVISDRDEY